MYVLVVNCIFLYIASGLWSLNTCTICFSYIYIYIYEIINPDILMGGDQIIFFFILKKIRVKVYIYKTKF
jgi:hypothetical protein